MATHTITLDVKKRLGAIPPCVVVRQGDTNSQTIVANIVSDGVAHTSTCSSVRLDILHANGKWARVNATKSGSKVTCTLPSAALSSHGLCKLAHFVFYTSTTTVESTEGFELRILPNVDANDSQGAKDYDDQLTQLYELWKKFEAQAETQEAARVSAEKLRVTAENARVSAEDERQSAESEREEFEEMRIENETKRIEAEKKRVVSENARVDNEDARKTRESERVENEETRQTTFSTLETNCNSAISQANAAAEKALAAAKHANSKNIYEIIDDSPAKILLDEGVCYDGFGVASFTDYSLISVHTDCGVGWFDPRALEDSSEKIKFQIIRNSCSPHTEESSKSPICRTDIQFFTATNNSIFFNGSMFYSWRFDHHTISSGFMPNNWIGAIFESEQSCWQETAEIYKVLGWY